MRQFEQTVLIKTQCTHLTPIWEKHNVSLVYVVYVSVVTVMVTWTTQSPLKTCHCIVNVSCGLSCDKSDTHESVVTVMVTRTTQSPFSHVIV